MKHDVFLTIKQKVLQGMFVLIVKDFGLKILAIFGQIILVRLVAPEYFGLYALIAFVVNIFEIFSDLGFSQAIVQQKKELTNVQLSTIFFIKLLLCAVAFVLLMASFPLINLFYHQLTEKHFIMIFILGTTIFPKMIKGVYFALFDRNFNFNIISKIEVFGIITYFIVAVIFALKEVFLLNFIYAVVAKEFIELFMAYHYNRWKPKFVFDLNSVKQMIRYGSFLQIGNLIAFVERSIIPIAGFKLSPYHLGMLDWSSNVSRLSNTLFENYGRAAFAGMVRIQDEKDKMSTAVSKSISMLNIFSFLFVIMVLGYAKEFTVLVISIKWVPALPSLYWFVSSLLFFGGSITVSHALLAIGKSKEILFFSGITIFAEIILAFLMMHYVGFVGIAIASFAMYVAQFVGYFLIGRRFSLNIKIRKPFFEKLIIFIFAFAAVVLLNLIFPNFSLITFIIKIVSTIVVYVFFLFLFSRDDLKELFKITNLVKSQTSLL